MQQIELLAPARDAETGIAAIEAGADAVYLGGPRFGARAQASVTVDEIARLVAYARLFNVRTYITLNTLLKEAELDDAQALIREIWQAGADALIIQDMGLLELELPPIPLFASTQCHITTPEKALFLEKAGFRRLILARELSLAQIAAIRAATALELECFVHGALCVGYSGQCYMSVAAGGRSGNRGDCAQPCRLAYDLLDETGTVLAAGRHWLSLKDMNRTAGIGDLLAAGISSFKIEGRLKDAAYIRNVVSHYRQTIDRELAARGLRKSSSGDCRTDFTPDPAKSFNRGFTSYFLHEAPDSPESPFTQKATGERLGRVASSGRDYFTLAGDVALAPGDGICFFDADQRLLGTRINRVEEGRCYPDTMQGLSPGVTIFRNRDTAFEKALVASPPSRRIRVAIALQAEDKGFRLTATDEDGVEAAVGEAGPFEPARNAEQAVSHLTTQLAKTGGTPYQATDTTVSAAVPPFVPASMINAARRLLLERLTQARVERYVRQEAVCSPTDHPYPESMLTFEGNVLNDRARAFYRRHGVQAIEPAAESGLTLAGRRVMTSRHCIRRLLGLCPAHPQQPLVPLKAPPQGRLYLDDGRHRYRLEFACERCEMELYQ